MRILLVSALLAAAPAVHASPLKVGVVHFEKVFSETEASRVDRGELVQLMNDKQAEVDRRKQKLAADRAVLAAQSGGLDLVARARREAELDAADADLRKWFAGAQAEVNARERELTQKVMADAKELAPSVARAEGVNVILSAAEALMWAAPGVVEVDLTAEIARALDLKRHAPRAR